jgi:hypothetical protein
MDEVDKIFFANFQTLGPLGCQGWVVIPQNVKKSQIHCTLMYMYSTRIKFADFFYHPRRIVCRKQHIIGSQRRRPHYPFLTCTAQRSALVTFQRR